MGRRAWRGRHSRWQTSRATSRRLANAQVSRQRAVPRRRSRPTRARASPTSSATTRRPTRAACAARSRTRRSTSSARGRRRCGLRRRSRSATGSPARRSTTSACSTASARCSRARSRRPSSSTSTRRSAASTPTRTTRPERMRADHTALANAYRSGMINETNNLDRTAIIDCRGPDPGLFHDAYRAFAVRARLDRAHGNHANQLIWEGPVAVDRRQPVRAQQLLGPGPLARRRGEGQGQGHGAPRRSPATSPRT